MLAMGIDRCGTANGMRILDAILKLLRIIVLYLEVEQRRLEVRVGYKLQTNVAPNTEHSANEK